MATVTQRGQGAVQGVVGTFDVIIYPVGQTGKTEQQFELEEVKDQQGFDQAWLARNEHRLMDWSFKLLGGLVPVNGVNPNELAAAGAAFIAPLGIVNLSGFAVVDFNGAYQNISGGVIDLGNTKVGELMTKFRRYTDAGQQTGIQTIPT
jgi:hypothetical protein